jgi:hypothetical protein
MTRLPLLLCSGAMLLTIACRTNESPELQLNDMEITAQVKSKLASDVGVSTVTNVSVNSTNGIVTLSGQVNSTDIKARAEAAAKSVPKVVRVINNLQVATSNSQGAAPAASDRAGMPRARAWLPESQAEADTGQNLRGC